MLETDFREMLIAQRQRTLARATRETRLTGNAEPVVLRLCRVSDDPQLETLAAFDGARIVPGRYVIAEVHGQIVAALPLAGGDVLADPFRRTAHIVPLLRMRAEQLTGLQQRRTWLGAFRWGLARG